MKCKERQLQHQILKLKSRITYNTVELSFRPDGKKKRVYSSQDRRAAIFIRHVKKHIFEWCQAATMNVHKETPLLIELHMYGNVHCNIFPSHIIRYSGYFTNHFSYLFQYNISYHIVSVTHKHHMYNYLLKKKVFKLHFLLSISNIIITSEYFIGK